MSKKRALPGTTRESKSELTDIRARALTEAENTRTSAKTARLRELRLARDATAEPPSPVAKTRKKTSR